MNTENNKRTAKDYLLLALKGMGMGAADVVPGVSGGTIAFIVGIYEELVGSIKNADKAVASLLKGKIGDFWKGINGSFLLAVAVGIGISFLSLAKLITWALSVYPVPVWAFFFGLVLASTIFVSKQVTSWKYNRWIAFVAGAAIAFYITVATPAQTPDALWFIFLSGAIAICAMILPGISGSFILLLLGKYEYMMQVIGNLNVPVIAVFIAGAAIGIVLFSKFLSFLLKNYHDITIAALAGFMLGSLNKVWPWKDAAESNTLPTEYDWVPVVAVIAGYALVAVLERVSAKKAK